MENTIQNHQKFRALYIGQDVLRSESQNYKVIIDACYLGFQFLENGSYLELTPLSMLSDLDAVEVANLQDVLFIDTADIREHMRMAVRNDWFQFRTADYLRSKGYALPFSGVSVQLQIEYKWIKLKD